MRAVLVHDLDRATRAALLMRPQTRVAQLLGLIEAAHAADKLRKATGRRHPRWGDGTLAAACAHLPLAPCPRRHDAEACAALAAVLAALALWRAERGQERRGQGGRGQGAQVSPQDRLVPAPRLH